jgi:hypothetical protein
MFSVFVAAREKGRPWGGLGVRSTKSNQSVDSISNPQASKSGSGMYLEFLLRRAHSRSRVERKYWSGESLYSRTTCSNSVIVGVIGPIGSGLPQLGFPRRFAMKTMPRTWEDDNCTYENLDSSYGVEDSRQIAQPS